jgi:hypothetical protein
VSVRPIAGRTAARGGGLVTRGLGTTLLVTRGLGGDAFERGFEIATLSAVDRGAALDSRTDRGIRVRADVDVEIREISLLTEGVTPWRRW